MGLNFLRRKKNKKLHFALCIADAPLEGATFKNDQDCTFFLVTGEVEPHDIIPRTTLKNIVEKFMKPAPLEGDVKIAEHQA